MIFKASAMVAILFLKMRSKLITDKTFAGQDFPSAILHSKAVGQIRKDISEHFTILTPIGFEAVFKGQIQHLEKVPSQ